MKNIVNNILAFCSVLLLSISCGDWKMLEEHPYSLSEGSYITNYDEAKSMVDGMYFQLRRDVGFGRIIPIIAESFSDYCYGRGTYESTFQSGITTSCYSRTQDCWAILYRVVRYSNVLLPKLAGIEMTETQYNELSAEVRFLRGFAYSYLVKCFDDVPFFDENDEIGTDKPKTSSEEIWKSIISDMEYAAENLPAAVTVSGHPDKTAAYFCLAEACMYLEDYDGAAVAAQAAIDQNVHSLVAVSVADDFEKIFGADVVTTPEEVFYMKYNRTPGIRNSMDWMFLCDPNPISKSGGAVGIYTDYENNNVIKEWLQEEGDLRHEYTLYEQHDNGELNTKTNTGMICIKFRDRQATGNGAGTDVPVIRYADVLLLYAEARARSLGAPDEKAMEALNMVHRRGYGYPPASESPVDFNLADYSSLDTFMELLLRESAYEQMFEVGKRYFTLKRLALLAEYAYRAGRVDSPSEVSPAAYYWPIPANEFTYNSMLDPNKDQNPGY